MSAVDASAQLELPQIYLITPAQLELSRFSDELKRCLDSVEIACLRLGLSTADEDRISRAADACREIAHARDIALVIENHIMLAGRLGLDGVHLTDGARSVRHARKELGDEAIVGADCGISRHDGMVAGEAGADYVTFGPAGQSALGDGRQAGAELFEWWSQMIEVPVVAEGALDVGHVAELQNCVDFFALGEEIWSAENPSEALRSYAAAMGRNG